MQKIRYITFEGGGGKGAAYVGALELLEELQILRYFQYDSAEGMTTHLDYERIKGLAGSSAGAITATMLAAGYRPSDFKAMLLQTERFSAIYKDNKNGGKIPTIETSSSGAGPLSIRPLVLKKHGYYTTPEGQEAKKWFGVATLLSEAIARGICIGLGWPSLLTTPIVNEIIDEFGSAIKDFYFDLGFLDGEILRNIVGDVLEEQLGDRNITFKTMFDKTHIHLKISGTCVNTHETVWFDHLGVWQNMCVADAVRISACFPVVFKPIVVFDPRTYYGSTPRRGAPSAPSTPLFLMIDGGVLNNNPIRAFDFPGKAEPINKCEHILTGIKPETPSPGRKLNPETLAFRLDVSRVQTRYIGLLSYLGGVLDTVTSLSEQSALSDPAEIKQTIQLDTTGLSTLDFIISPGTPEDPEKKPEKKLEEFIARSKKEAFIGLDRF